VPGGTDAPGVGRKKITGKTSPRAPYLHRLWAPFGRNTYTIIQTSLGTYIAANKPCIWFLKVHFPYFFPGQCEVL